MPHGIRSGRHSAGPWHQQNTERTADAAVPLLQQCEHSHTEQQLGCDGSFSGFSMLMRELICLYRVIWHSELSCTGPRASVTFSPRAEPAIITYRRDAPQPSKVSLFLTDLQEVSSLKSVREVSLVPQEGRWNAGMWVMTQHDVNLTEEAFLTPLRACTDRVHSVLLCISSHIHTFSHERTPVSPACRIQAQKTDPSFSYQQVLLVFVVPHIDGRQSGEDQGCCGRRRIRGVRARR